MTIGKRATMLFIVGGSVYVLLSLNSSKNTPLGFITLTSVFTSGAIIEILEYLKEGA